MSEEVFVQVDNKAAGKLSVVFGLSGVIMVAGAFLVIGRFSERLDRVERDVQTKATTNEVIITTTNINEKLDLLGTQLNQVQITLQSFARPRRD